MNFEEFKQLVKEIRGTITCRECDSKFEDRDISLIGTILKEGYLQAKCPKCKHNTIINVFFGPANRKHRKILKKKPRIITPNDILDMQNFLRSFDGDFIKLFNKKS
ncbi:hypothetical protein HN748_00070 [Candidatus Peregrinibacteria bacterium]|jgi:hypothetical protein|nr:hypothetical protein [Candidatus Peregrinibacteria bacterium]MBT7483234.1 hypothetical protein [Candidatus Peregrinibacteria bacterium]MBT7702607.1 hypothetical protein [Candidatus Peregrinibacteria bacterium]